MFFFSSNAYMDWCCLLFLLSFYWCRTPPGKRFEEKSSRTTLVCPPYIYVIAVFFSGGYIVYLWASRVLSPADQETWNEMIYYGSPMKISLSPLMLYGDLKSAFISVPLFSAAGFTKQQRSFRNRCSKSLLITWILAASVWRSLFTLLKVWNTYNQNNIVNKTS